jgi:pseudouridine-5'-phosphate glycosidase
MLKSIFGQKGRNQTSYSIIGAYLIYQIFESCMHNSFLDIHPEVALALEKGNAVVALESTIISHGMPYPQNVETAKKVEDVVRSTGAIPATIAVVNGRLKAGMDVDEIEFIGKQGGAIQKCSRRDLPVLVSKKGHGATTVAATMIIAEMAGISIFATGGIGGVHRGGHVTMDISADLQELARTNVAVVSAGAKSILDIGLTLEYLETLGVPVIGYQTSAFPAFYVRDSGFLVDAHMDDVSLIAKTIRSKWKMGLNGGLLICNPIPKSEEMQYAEVESAIQKAVLEAQEKKITGKYLTPFLLSRIERLTDGASLKSNVQLVLNNAKLAGQIAVQYAKLVSDFQ